MFLLSWREQERRAGQSMISAQASVGAAATSPTTGTILMTAEVIRQGAAARPQPEASRHNVETRIHFIEFAWKGMAAMAAVSPVGRRPGILGEARRDSFAPCVQDP